MTNSQDHVRGLATIALLKVNYDAGRDHIDMFIPFALDAMRSLDTDSFGIGQVKKVITKRFQLTIPDHTLSTVLSRACKQGYCRRSAGLYERQLDTSPIVDLTEQIKSVEREHKLLASRLRQFAADTRVPIASDDDGLQVLLAFVDDKHVAMILDEAEGVLFRSRASALSGDQTRVTAQFLKKCYESEPELTKYVQRMVEGFVLQNALLLRDIGSSPGFFRDLLVYFDSLFLLRALGLAGVDSQRASRELIDLLRATRAQLFVFERTVAEMKRILRYYQAKIGSTSGIADLRKGVITQHLISQRYSPSDVAQALGLMDTQLRGLGLTIRSFPKHHVASTLDEEDLTQRLQRPGQPVDERVRHDVDCAAAIMTLRREQEARSLDTAGAVFVTTNKAVVDTVRDWYKSQGKSGVPPMVRHLTLSTAAWLKKPEAAGNVKLNELIASCSVALQPSAQRWQALKDQLEKLKQTGELSSEEMVAVVAHELTEARLIECDDAEYEDPSTVTEIVEAARKDITAETKRRLAEADAALAEERRRASVAEDQAAVSAEQQRQTELKILAAATQAGNIARASAFWVGVVLLISGVLVTLAGIVGFVEEMLAWVAGIASLVTLVYGGSLKRYTELFGEWIRRRELRRILGPNAPACPKR